MKNDDFFFLAPPLFCRRGYGFAVIQLGLDFSETMMLKTTFWNGSDYLRFWHNELSEMLSRTSRNKGLLPNGIYRNENNREYFLERWDVYRIGSEFVFHDTTVVCDDDRGFSSCMTPSTDWWTLVEDYEDTINLKDDDGNVYSPSEWRVSANAVADWCHKYSCVFDQMENTDLDKDFKW